MKGVRTHRRVSGSIVGRTCGLVLAAMLFAVAAAPAASAAPAPSPGSPQAADLTASATTGDARLAAVGDLAHINEVQSFLSDPASISAQLVYYIGDSTARESIVNESKFGSTLLTVGSVNAQPFVLASRNQTFPLDRLIVRGLPQGQPAIAFITVGLSRFTNPPATSPSLGAPVGHVAKLSPWSQHQYSTADILTVAQKRAKVREWLARRYPLFKKNEPLELQRLRALVQACQTLGWRVALVELPVNTAIVGHAWDVPRHKYQRDCAALASSLHVKYLRFASKVGLKNSDFYDLIHLVGNGPTGARTRWMRQLAIAARDAGLLKPVVPTAPAPSHG